MLNFDHPEFLVMLLAVPIAIFFHSLSLRQNKKRAMLFANFDALKRADHKYKYPKYVIWIAFRVIIIVLFSFAMAGTHLNYETSVNYADYVLALDASSSMSSTDIYPTRFDAAKDAELLFLDSLSDANVKSRVAIVTFAGTTLIHAPPTYDLFYVQSTVKSPNLSYVPGTAIGEAIVNSVNILYTSDRAKVIFLITDGASNIGVDIDYAIDYAKRNGVVVNTIGVGTVTETIYEDRLSTSLDTETLAKIAEETKGSYYLVENTAELKSVFLNEHLRTYGIYDLDLTRYLLFAILAMFLTEWFLVNTRLKVIP